MIGTMTSLSMLIGRLEVLVDLFSVLWYSLNGLKRRNSIKRCQFLCRRAVPLLLFFNRIINYYLSVITKAYMHVLT